MKTWKNISISSKLYFVVGTMATLVIIELLTLRFAMDNLSAVRAFVGGEASWSKAQKNAVYRFQRYAMTKNEADYLAFRESLSVPDGDRKASVLVNKVAVLQEVLMDLAQIRSGKLEIRKAEHDVLAIALECISHLTAESIRTGSEIILKAGEPLPAYFDSTRIGQVITNLLTNALKYGEKKPVMLKVYKENDLAVIEISDNGLGISEDKQKQVFERFERVNEDPAVSGLGLGLYITKQIIEAHNGSVTIESSLGKGTTFRAQFPVRS